MSFILFEKQPLNGKLYYRSLNQGFSLAGYNLIYKLWIERGKPVNYGWSVNKRDLLQAYDKTMDIEKYAFIIDFHPSSKERIGLIELENIHIYTYGDGEKAYWSPMMLELYNLYYEEEYVDLTGQEKSDVLNNIECPIDRGKILEFYM